MKRWVTVIAAASLGLGVLSSPGAAARAEDPGGALHAWCVETSCGGEVRFSGDTGGNNAVPAQYMPCWMGPAYTAEEVVVIVAGWLGEAKRDTMPYVQSFVGQDGMWWAVGHDGTPEGQACAAAISPWLAWVPAGGSPPADPIDPETLAYMALKVMQLQSPTITIHPTGRSFVRLPVFVWAQGITDTTRQVTATIPTGLSVTVTAEAGPIVVQTNGPAQRFQDCGTTGSSYGRTSAHVLNAGPGTHVDCGVIYRRSSVGGPYRLWASLTWNPTWSGSDGSGGTLDPITVTAASVSVPVFEIQSRVDRAN